MKLTGLQVAQGEAAPWWYGVAYYSPYSDHVVCYPVPLNLLVRWCRNIWWLLRRGKRDALAKAYAAGRSAGLGEYREAVETINRLAKDQE